MWIIDSFDVEASEVNKQPDRRYMRYVLLLYLQHDADGNFMK